MADIRLMAGIVGISGSGKTYLLHRLKERMGDDLSILSMDNYYRPILEQRLDKNGKVNFDLPEGLDHVQFLNDLADLKAGKTVRRKKYTFNNPLAAEEFLEIKPAPVLLAEGIFLFHYPEVFASLDYKVYIHTDEQITLERRIQRDVKERGYPEHEVLYQWHNHVLPSHRLYVLPFREHADIVIDNHGPADEKIELLKDLLLEKAGQ